MALAKNQIPMARQDVVKLALPSVGAQYAN